MTEFDTRGSRLRMARSRGAASGFLLVLLGIWGALIPFIGPYIDFAFTPDQAWVWTSARGWLEVLPGAVTALGGLLLLVSGNRATAHFGGWLAVLGGAWFVVGRAFAGPLGIYGNAIVIDHGYAIQSLYAHLSEITVKGGQMVKKDEIIARTGTSGLASGDHLHFSIQVDGIPVDPKQWWDANWYTSNIESRLR